MQAVREAHVGGENKSFVKQKSSWEKGKENCMGPPACRPQSKEKQTMQENILKIPQKSKLPVLAKTKPPPDFQKMHQVWQNQFQKGKAISKKSCTRPRPFNLSQKGDKFRIASVTDVGHPVATSSNMKSPVAGLTGREPLSEVFHGQNNTANSKDGSTMHFKADPAALNSIIFNVGISTAGGATGKLSLAQRVPMRVSSNAHPFSGKNIMVRNSMYTAPCSYPESMPRFSWLPNKATEPRALIKQKNQTENRPPDVSLHEHATSREECAIPSQVNSVIQQMTVPLHTPDASNEIFKKQEEGPELELPESRCELPVAAAEISDEEKDLLKEPTEKPSADSKVEVFVADSQALASILSNTGETGLSCGRVSLAQRVLAQSRNMPNRGNMGSSGSLTGQVTPKPSCGRVSVLAKDSVFSSCRISKNSQTPTDSPVCSARRIPHAKPSARLFSQERSVTFKKPIFPKTPRALALEMANKKLEAKQTDLQSSTKSTVRWADQTSPAPVLCEDEPPIEKVVLRLFSDGESSGDTEEGKQVPGSTPKQVTIGVAAATSIQSKKDLVSESSAANHEATAAVYSQALSLHQQFASLCTANCAEQTKASLPLSFLAHPAVQALQSSTLGSHSLSHIARLRLHATVSAKQRFWDTCLDEECAFYTSRGPSGTHRSCIDPVAFTLEKQENLHFIPIPSGES
ncbi:hypothetical protein XENTR_v10006609 [Xenopus tropicalis]|uniref:Tastin isoform X1 n=1 Tax=Xenopus tropicalis TaxID=8364 RepID=A0A8J0QQJ5_XENTR|nr:tastin isoform X1 [Xenopus tropicalis]KAE8626374.1 hypothetical protein XENTR_v10006609 [Xenopus tropicalis]KAE8626375.1 hypothetical protein XENTR_v10006609 [Xenopus tropicalis]